MQQVMDIEQARRAVDRRADILVAQGGAAGGHSGFVSTLVLVSQVVEVAGGRPVVAAGGIADGRGLAASLCLGASGVVIGTRFLASTEMAVRPEWKAMIVGAESTDARDSPLIDLILPRYNHAHDPASARVLKTAFAEQWCDRRMSWPNVRRRWRRQSSMRFCPAVERTTCRSLDRASV
jgi:enoyl-[acyl-carrier protein] reductase II